MEAAPKAMEELSLHILDIAQNAVAAQATSVEIAIVEDTAIETLTLSVADNGIGMDEQTVRQATEWGFSTKPHNKGGFGLPMFQRAARVTGGSMQITSAPGLGTDVRAVLHTGHPAYVPLGDMSETFVILMVGHPDVEFTYRRSCNDASFILSTAYMKQVLGNVPLNCRAVIEWSVRRINEQTALLGSKA